MNYTYLQPKVLWALVFILFTLMMSTQAFSNTTLNCDSEKINIHCGKTPSAEFDKDNRLWVVFEFEQNIYLTVSNDRAKSFEFTTKVTTQNEAIYTNGENRPKIAFGKHAEIYLSWTKKTAGRFNGDIRFSRSIDAGKTFSPVLTVNDDNLLTGHRFDSLSVNQLGDIFISWIDKRDQFKALQAGDKSVGAAIYYTVSTDNGLSFHPNLKIADSTCECCRIAMSINQKQQAVLMWRHIFAGSIRDHAIAIVDSEHVVQPIVRATIDNWKIEACPHHGPAIIEGLADKYHMTWFTAAEEKKGLYYAMYDANNQQLFNQRGVSQSPTASHPHIVASQNQIQMVWKEFDGERTQIFYQRSIDGGSSWTSAQSIGFTLGDSDHPFLQQTNSQTWLKWHSANEGFRVFEIKSSGNPQLSKVISSEKADE